MYLFPSVIYVYTYKYVHAYVCIHICVHAYMHAYIHIHGSRISRSWYSFTFLRYLHTIFYSICANLFFSPAVYRDSHFSTSVSKYVVFGLCGRKLNYSEVTSYCGFVLIHFLRWLQMLNFFCIYLLAFYIFSFETLCLDLRIHF